MGRSNEHDVWRDPVCRVSSQLPRALRRWRRKRTMDKWNISLSRSCAPSKSYRHVLHLFDYATGQEGSDDLASPIQVEHRPVGTSLKVDVLRIGGVLPYLQVLTDEITASKTSMRSQMEVDPEIDKEQQIESIVHCECGLTAKLLNRKESFPGTNCSTGLLTSSKKKLCSPLHNLPYGCGDFLVLVPCM